VTVSTSRVVVAAPVATVWAVLTEPRYVAQWQYGSVLETDWQVGSAIRFTAEWDGQTFAQWGTVLFVDEPHELRYSLFAPRPDLEDAPQNYFTMTYSLTPDDGSTIVTITQDDPRPSTGAPVDGDADDGDADADDDDADNPVLQALKALAESIA